LHEVTLLYGMAWEGEWIKLVDCQLTPVMSDVSAVPEKLWKMIHCNCKIACGQCQLKTCDSPYNHVVWTILTKRRMKIVIDNVYAFNSYFTKHFYVCGHLAKFCQIWILMAKFVPGPHFEYLCQIWYKSVQLWPSYWRLIGFKMAAAAVLDSLLMWILVVNLVLGPHLQPLYQIWRKYMQ